MKSFLGRSCTHIALVALCASMGVAQDNKKADILGDFGFHGYARAGMNSTAQGGEGGCYGSAAAGHYVGRIGDECDTYVEFAFDMNHQEDSVRSWKLNTRFSFETEEGAQFNDYQSYTEPGSSTSNADVALREVNISGKGYIPFLPSASIWGGKRFYKRKYIDLLDLYYLNDSGYGFGVEGVHSRLGNLSVAWTTATQQSYTGKTSANGEPVVQLDKVDARLEDIKLRKNLGASVAVIYGRGNRTDYQVQSGEPNATGGIFTLETAYTPKNGKHVFVAQVSTHGYGNAAMTNASGEAVNTYASWEGDLNHSERFILYGKQKMRNISLPYSVLYSRGVTISDLSVADKKPFVLSAVLSPMYKESSFTGTRVEVGVEKYQQSSDVVRHGLTKAMVMQTFRPSEVYDLAISPYLGAFWGKNATENYIANPKGDAGNLRVGVQLSASW